MERYDYIVVGAGLFGCVFAREAVKAGKKVLVVEKRNHIGGNCYTRNEDGINVHVYGAHIFRTSREDVWDYIRRFASFNDFINTPVALYHGRKYNLPFNMNTFEQIWGVKDPETARAKIDEQRREIQDEPKNLEEKAISLVGRDVYEILIREYTEKQWGRKCTGLPASILRRLPVRFEYNNNYYNDKFQGIPVGGYTRIFDRMLSGCDVKLSVDAKSFMATHEVGLRDNPRSRIVYTGPIDDYFGFCFGPLEYRSLRFEHERHDEVAFLQDVAVMNYTDNTVPYTRTIEHKHFEFGKQQFTIVSKEYSLEWTPGVDPYYPINDERNQCRYGRYEELAHKTPNVIFGGRLGCYRYTDMQDTIASALELAESVL